jgi:hypothetical protein
VNASVLQNAERSSPASDPRYATTSHAMGGTSRTARAIRRRSDIGNVVAGVVSP